MKLLLPPSIQVLLSVGMVLASEMPAGMKTYQMALLEAGPREKEFAGERVLQAMQEERLGWLGRLHAEGRAVVSGPIWQGGTLRGVLVLDVPSRPEAEAVLAEDPFVRAGRETIRIHPWWCAESAFRKTSNVVRLARTWLVLLKRPANAPAYDDAKLEEIQAAHLAHIGKMAASGDLVAAGPFGDDGSLRGALVMRTLDVSRVRELVAEDPAVRAGRLEAEIVAWSIPEGALP